LNEGNVRVNSPFSILIADDEDTFRESTSRLLQREGFACHCARNADEAIESLDRQRFDLLIADVHLPHSDSRRLICEARNRSSQMAIIIVTGHPSTETAVRSIELSVIAYLTKPLDFDHLLAQVKSAAEVSFRRCRLSIVHERMQTCLVDLEMGIASKLPLHQEIAGESIWPGTVRTLAACLSELLKLSAACGATWESNNLCDLLDCPQKPLHRQLIHETIEVLRKTKDDFKCKALANLRAKLENSLKPS
jgi:DNA-binding response OmpR family regulator